ncbi:TyeA family type III secretion system gatekeeper subunit [Pseudomonas purpurea]|uniref:TyeA family type III secretion system gatekeeper subunit n=1 Tax=Pseudomonas purpurea TaxID=3136737 RepID=UPI0032658B0E
MAYGPSDLMGGLIGLIDKRWANVQDVQRLIVPLAIKDAARQIHFFREIKRLIRLIPTEIFTDEEQRQNLLNACQLALDLAIDQEEDEWRAQ